MEPWKSSLPELSKWMGLVAAIWVQAFAGNTAAYANYSSTLKSVLNLDQVQLNYLALSKDFGENVGILAGVLCNKVPPWVILSIAAVECFVGFGSLWLVASRTIDPRPLWQMCLAICIGGNSMTWFNTAVLVTCMRNFPKNRGTIVGFLKGFIGLSGAIFTQIFNSLLGSNAVSLLLFLALGPTAVCLVSMGFIRPVQPVSSPTALQIEEERQQFRLIHIICIALAVYLFIAAFLDQFFAQPLVLKIVVSVMFLFLVSPIWIPVRVLLRMFITQKLDVEEALLLPDESQPVGTSDKSNLSVDSDGGQGQRIDPKSLKQETDKMNEGLRKRGVSKPLEVEEDADILLALGEGAVKRKKRRPRRGEDFKLRQALVKADFWLLFFTFFCGVGTSITAGNNLSQLGQAQGYQDVSIFVLLSSIWGFLGRLGGGSVSEHFIRASLLPRPVWIAAAQALMVAAHLLFAFALRGSLYVATSIVGLCYGNQIAVTVPTASEIFGLKHFGILYNFITLADPIASLLFSTLLAGSLYDREVARQYGISSDAASNLVCTGAHCFRLTFLIMAAVSVVGVGFCLILSWRLKPVYRTLYGSQDSVNASYSSLPSTSSYSSLPSTNVSSSSLPPASFTFSRVSSSASLSEPAARSDLQ